MAGKHNQVPGIEPAELERIMKARTTESENTDTQVLSVYISMVSVKENRAPLSAQFRIRPASVADNECSSLKTD
ncbi:hypothetical protein AAC387_Pa05g1798 [Persea americana]